MSILMGSEGARELGRSEVDGKGSKELRGVKGDMDPRIDRVFCCCTGVFGSASTS